MGTLVFEMPPTIEAVNRHLLRRAFGSTLLPEHSTVLDFSFTTFIDGAGWNELHQIAWSAQKLGCKLRVFAVHKHLHAAFEQQGFLRQVQRLEKLPRAVRVRFFGGDSDYDGEELVGATASDDPKEEDSPQLWRQTVEDAAHSRLRVGPVGPGSGEIGVFFDGEPLGTYAAFCEPGHGPAGARLWITNGELSAELLRWRLSDLLPAGIGTTDLPVHMEWADPAALMIRLRVLRETSLATEFVLRFNTGDWKKLWSITEYAAEFRHQFQRNVSLINGFVLYARQDLPTEICLGALYVDPGATGASLVSAWSEAIHQVHRATEHVLTSSVRNESLITHFRFPTEIRTACEQYLLYFVQFLHDLGVEADAELQHRAGEVLFSVTPETGPDALERINTALSVYLNIPAHPGFETSMGGAQEPWLQGLTAQVFHLKGQLAMQANILQMKDTMLQMKDTILQTKDTAITSLNSAIVDLRAREEALIAMQSGTVVRDSLVGISAGGQRKDAEPLVGRSVSLIPWEKGPFLVDLRSFLRELKASFNDDDLPPPGNWF